jgi:hypothetical protein
LAQGNCIFEHVTIKEIWYKSQIHNNFNVNYRSFNDKIEIKLEKGDHFHEKISTKPRYVNIKT